ncbi:MAG: cupredoxin domain-containing protein, partial [Thermomicrobiales bacterium]|nr:cupredoxin domain-containing protein [Thermomicrobiales bacterium]
SVALPVGETDKTVVINAPAGDYEYYCNVPGHKEAGMVGTMHVVAGAAAPAAEGAATAEATEAPAATPSAPEASPAAEAAQQAPAAAPAAAETVTVTSHDIYFDPKEVTIPANTDVTFDLPNEGVTEHDFSIDALGIAVPLPIGETDKSVVINAPPGDYEYYCNVPGHKEAGMVGTLHVVEGAAAPAAAEGAAPAATAAQQNAAPAEASPATTPAAAAASPAASAETVTVVSHDIYFDPKEFTIPANTDVTVKLPNEGVTAHDFSIDALGISVPLPVGETDKEVVINAPPGTYEYYCNVPGHKEAGMVGTLIVK